MASRIQGKKSTLFYLSTEAAMKVKTITSVNEYRKWVASLEGTKLIFRGQANHDWKILSSACRLTGNEDLATYNKIIDVARIRGHDRHNGKLLSDLEILTIMQHYQIPTCLIDFTTDPLVALWFACLERKNDKNEKLDGSVVAINCNEISDNCVVDCEDARLSIQKLFDKDIPMIWEPSPVCKRVTTQNSVFAFGKENIHTDLKIKITSSSKKQIIKILKEEFSVNEESLFPDHNESSPINSLDKQYAPIESVLQFLEPRIINLERLETAILDYTAVIQKNSDFTPAYFNRGVARFMLGQYKDAKEDFDKLIILIPTSIIAYFFRGNANFKLGECQDAIKDLDKAIELNPEYAVAYYNRGTIKSRLGQCQDAIKDLDKAIKLKPELPEAYNNRGNVKNQLENPKEAITDFDKSIDLNPEFADAYFNRGIAKDKLEQFHEAITDFDKVIELDPELYSGYFRRGIARYKLGEFQEAVNDYDRAIELNPKSSDVYNSRGIARGELEQPQDAMEDFDKAIELNPEIAEFYYNRGLVKKILGQHDAAKIDFDKAAELNSDKYPKDR